MKLTEREEFLADFMVQYPVADMRTMCMAVEGIFSDNPFAKNALAKGSYTVRNMVAKKLMSSRKDGYYSLHKKVADEFYDLEPYYKVNGSESTRRRIASVAWIAAVMRAMGVSLCYDENEVSFACSTVWRSLNPVVSNTSRYAGVLNLCIEKYAVYDVSDSNMLWQREAEESLFIQTPKNKNVSLDGILMLTDKPITEQTIDIVLRSIKSSRGWKKPKVNSFSLKSYAPITVSKNFKRAYLMNYEDFKRHISTGLLLKYTVARKWLEKYFDNQFSFEESGVFDCVIYGKKAFWYYHNDVIKLMTIIKVVNNLDKEIAVVCDYRLKDIVEFFLQDKAEIYVIEKEFYIQRGADKNGSFNIAERIARSIKNREGGEQN